MSKNIEQQSPHSEGWNTSDATIRPHSYEYLTEVDQPLFDLALKGFQKSNDQEKILTKKYFSLPDENQRPFYLDIENIFDSHKNRCLIRIEKGLNHQDWAYTSKLVTQNEICARKPLLASTLSMSINEALSCPYDISDALNFFISMVCSVDDYIDQEDTYHLFGEKLCVISHAYMDLMEISLYRVFEGIPDATKTIQQIYERILNLETSLIRSERSQEGEVASGLPCGPTIRDKLSFSPEQILQSKSSGIEIVDVFVPLAKAKTEKIVLCRNFIQKIGEVGQIIDDTIDLDYDSTHMKSNNYLLLKGWSPIEAMTEVKDRLQATGNLAKQLNSLPAWSIWKTYNGFVELIKNNLQIGIKTTPSLLINVFPTQFAQELQKLSSNSIYKLPIEMMLL